MDIEKYKKIFTLESEKYLTELDTLLIRVEKDFNNHKLWGEIHGKIHSVKGMARALSLDRITQMAHLIEDWCKQFQEGAKPSSPNAVQLIFDGTELLKTLVAEKDDADPLANQEWYEKLTSRFKKGPEELPEELPSETSPYQTHLSVPSKIDQVRVKYTIIEELLGLSQ